MQWSLWGKRGNVVPIVRKTGIGFPLLKCPTHYDYTFRDCCALKMQLIHPQHFKFSKFSRGSERPLWEHACSSAFGHAHLAFHAIHPSTSTSSLFLLYEMTTAALQWHDTRRTCCCQCSIKIHYISICTVSVNTVALQQWDYKTVQLRLILFWPPRGWQFSFSSVLRKCVGCLSSDYMNIYHLIHHTVDVFQISCISRFNTSHSFGRGRGGTHWLLGHAAVCHLLHLTALCYQQ